MAAIVSATCACLLVSPPLLKRVGLPGQLVALGLSCLSIALVIWIELIWRLPPDVM
jgi:hypothetical protein